MRFLFAPRMNYVDLGGIAIGSRLFMDGHWIAALASIVALSFISVLGEGRLLAISERVAA